FSFCPLAASRHASRDDRVSRLVVVTLQLIGHLAELNRQFDQRPSREDFVGLASQLQTNFRVVPTFPCRWHGGGSPLENIFWPPTPPPGHARTHDPPSA